jgi:hypothetical protein
MSSRPCAGPFPGQPCPTRALVPVRRDSKTAARCPTCRTAWQQAKDGRRPMRRTYAEQQRRAQTVAEWVQANGYVCPGCPISNGNPHPADPTSNPLTAEHIKSFAETGNEHGPLSVMCQRGNSAGGARLARRAGG